MKYNIYVLYYEINIFMLCYKRKYIDYSFKIYLCYVINANILIIVSKYIYVML